MYDTERIWVPKVAAALRFLRGLLALRLWAVFHRCGDPSDAETTWLIFTCHQLDSTWPHGYHFGFELQIENLNNSAAEFWLGPCIACNVTYDLLADSNPMPNEDPKHHWIRSKCQWNSAWHFQKTLLFCRLDSFPSFSFKTMLNHVEQCWQNPPQLQQGKKEHQATEPGVLIAGNAQRSGMISERTRITGFYSCFMSKTHRLFLTLLTNMFFWALKKGGFSQLPWSVFRPRQITSSMIAWWGTFAMHPCRRASPTCASWWIFPETNGQAPGREALALVVGNIGWSAVDFASMESWCKCLSMDRRIYFYL